MKKKILYKYLVLLLAVGLLYSCGAPKEAATGQNSDYGALIEQQAFTFVARRAIPTEDARFNPRLMFPQNGNNLYQLNGLYDVKITPDSVIAFLPFFGRSYVAPIDPTEGGIRFTSTDFSYTRKMKKKNYEITIVPKDVREVRSLHFTVSPGGFAYLQVSSTNRTPISFSGIIESR